MLRTPFNPPAIVKPANVFAELAVEINAEHRHVETALRAGLEHARRAGELLLKAKQQCRHGEWLPWLKTNVKFSGRTARAFMSIASRWDELANWQDLANLTYTDAIKLLTAPAEDEPKAQAPADLPAVHLPELLPGRSYIVGGTSQRFGKSAATVDPHPKHPGYWCFAFHFGIENEWAFTEECHGARCLTPKCSGES
jgi:hypothetical protein